MNKLIQAALMGLVLAAPASLSLVAPAAAETAAAQHVNVRGSILSLDGNTLQLKSREGETVAVTLAEGWQVNGVAKAEIADIKPGDYVGIASLPREAGGDGALEVVIFPPALKGAGEGSFGWDLKPKSQMTNATVADAVTGVDGRSLTVDYHGQKKTITVPEGTPVVTFAPASEADLIPGAVVFISAEKDAGGAISAGLIVVGTNGVIPPM